MLKMIAIIVIYVAVPMMGWSDGGRGGKSVRGLLYNPGIK